MTYNNHLTFVYLKSHLNKTSHIWRCLGGGGGSEIITGKILVSFVIKENWRLKITNIIVKIIAKITIITAINCFIIIVINNNRFDNQLLKKKLFRLALMYGYTIFSLKNW